MFSVLSSPTRFHSPSTRSPTPYPPPPARSRCPHEFKIACLTDIRELFPPEWNPFFAGFGNRGTDLVSYTAVGVPAGRIFTINPRGEVVCETSKYTRAWSLAGINGLIDEVFPPLEGAGPGAPPPRGGMRAQQDFADFNFWCVLGPIDSPSDVSCLFRGENGMRGSWWTIV